MKPQITWTPDCQGKWNYDGALIGVSTRYWPCSGGFTAFDTATRRWEGNDDRPEIRPSAHATIYLNDGHDDVALGMRPAAWQSRCMPKPPTCPTHPHVTLRCPACAGSKGGKVGGRSTSPKKRRAARANGRLAADKADDAD